MKNSQKRLDPRELANPNSVTRRGEGDGVRRRALRRRGTSTAAAVRQLSGAVDVGNESSAACSRRETGQSGENERGERFAGGFALYRPDLKWLPDRIGWLPASVSSDSTAQMKWRFASESQRPKKDGDSTAEE